MFELFKIPAMCVLGVYGVMGMGMLCRKGEWITRETSDVMFRLVVNLLSPCLIASKVIGNEAFQDPRNLYFPPLTGVGVVVLGLVVGWLCACVLPKSLSGMTTSRQLGTFAVCVGMLNYGYVPIPLLQDLYPGDDKLLAVLFLQNVGTEFALWTLCVFVLVGRFDREALLKVVNVPSMAIVGSVLINVFGLDEYVPTLVMKPIHMLGQAAIPISLLFVGAIIVDCIDRKQIAAELGYFTRVGIISCILRLGVLPVLIILAARYLPCSRELKIVLVIHASMASAIFPIVMTKLYKGCVKTALATVLTNTFVALITTPVWIALGLRLIDRT